MGFSANSWTYLGKKCVKIRQVVVGIVILGSCSTCTNTVNFNASVCFWADLIAFASTSMDAKLSQLQSIGQKDKAQAYLSLLAEALSQSDGAAIARDVHAILQNALTQNHVGQVVQRQVLGTLAERLASGEIKDSALKKQIVEDAIGIAQPSGNVSAQHFEEQVRAYNQTDPFALLKNIPPFT